MSHPRVIVANDDLRKRIIVGLINIATKTPAPVPLGEGLSIVHVSSKEWWNLVELELEF